MAITGNIGFYTNRPYDPNRGRIANFSFPTTTTPIASAPTPPISVGLTPEAYEAVLYGKEKPLYIGGSLLIGGRIIEGPFYDVDENGDPTVSAIYYFAENANPTGSHDITEFRIRGAVAAVDINGYLTDLQFAASAVVGKLPRVQYRTGTRTQLPFDVSISRYGANAIAYRQGIVVSLENFPLRATNGIIPFLGVYVEDSSFGDPSDPVARQDLLETLLRYARYDDSEFEVDVPGTWHFLIIPNKQTMLEFLQNCRRLYVHWNITYTDKMRIIDPTDFTIDVEVTPNNHVLGSMVFSKTDPLIVPRRKNLKYIDVDRDNEPNLVSAQEDVVPAPSTSSVDEENIELPVGMTASEAAADVNVSLYEELAVRSQMQATLQPNLFVAEAGDAVRATDSRVHTISYIGRIHETQHDLNTFRTDIKSGEVLNCGAEADEEGIAALFLSADSSGIEETGGYAPVMPIDAEFLPTGTLQNFQDFQIIECDPPADNGEVVSVYDPADFMAAFQYVFGDDTYVYYVDHDAGNGDTPDGYIIRIRLDNFSSRTVLDWGTEANSVRGVPGIAFSAAILDGKIYLGVDADGAADSYVAIIDLSNFTTAGMEFATLGPSLRPRGMAAFDGYVYIATFDGSSNNYIHRLDASDNTIDVINGTTGTGHQLLGGVVHEGTGKIFFSPVGKNVNDEWIGVLDTNATFDDDALEYFSITQDTNVDYALRYTNSMNREPWIVDDTVRLFCQTIGDEVRISSFSVGDYTVADSGYDLSSYVGIAPFDDTSKLPKRARVHEDYTYILSTRGSLSVQLIKLANDYSTIEVIDEVEP